MRAAGLSGRKVEYIQSLATHFKENNTKREDLEVHYVFACLFVCLLLIFFVQKMPDEDVLNFLLKVKGLFFLYRKRLKDIEKSTYEFNKTRNWRVVSPHVFDVWFGAQVSSISFSFLSFF